MNAENITAIECNYLNGLAYLITFKDGSSLMLPKNTDKETINLIESIIEKWRKMSTKFTDIINL